jgi:NTE family protein
MVIFQIDLFSAHGPVPQTLFEIAQREKEIRYSSRMRLNTDIFCELQAIRRAIRHLRPTISAELAGNADWQLLDHLSCDAAVTIVQLIHRRAAYWTQSNDYEFSRFTMEEHWDSGRTDVEHMLNHPEWKSRKRPEEGVKVLDLTRDLDPATKGRAR